MTSPDLPWPTFSPAVMTTQTTEKQDGLRALEGAIEKVTSVIKEFGGTLTVKMAPKVSFVIVEIGKCEKNWENVKKIGLWKKQSWNVKKK